MVALPWHCGGAVPAFFQQRSCCRLSLFAFCGQHQAVHAHARIAGKDAAVPAGAPSPERTADGRARTRRQYSGDKRSAARAAKKSAFARHRVRRDAVAVWFPAAEHSISAGLALVAGRRDVPGATGTVPRRVNGASGQTGGYPCRRIVMTLAARYGISSRHAAGYFSNLILSVISAINHIFWQRGSAPRLSAPLAWRAALAGASCGKAATRRICALLQPHLLEPFLCGL